ncbi:hypothetical protein [Sphingobium sp. B2D3C]|uniref:hypothetical protein n=1 Tax=Sphingobium sp. B2D3C TaxID=2940581 RepID=UPI002224041D|nr:hypothetical protein [Sphingobium sp. B2D3C]MCW2380829.1 hypothetical protein [Sphingobium sp. B2D3B]MCW2399064.1 hypothetical protein [Sphingobium sp. B2D3C]
MIQLSVDYGRKLLNVSHNIPKFDLTADDRTARGWNVAAILRNPSNNAAGATSASGAPSENLSPGVLRHCKGRMAFLPCSIEKWLISAAQRRFCLVRERPQTYLDGKRTQERWTGSGPLLVSVTSLTSSRVTEKKN